MGFGTTEGGSRARHSTVGQDLSNMKHPPSDFSARERQTVPWAIGNSHMCECGSDRPSRSDKRDDSDRFTHGHIRPARGTAVIVTESKVVRMVIRRSHGQPSCDS
jgi:hypothetical protein